jgi:hypothetical protein
MLKLAGCRLKVIQVRSAKVRRRNIDLLFSPLLPCLPCFGIGDSFTERANLEQA